MVWQDLIDPLAPGLHDRHWWHYSITLPIDKFCWMYVCNVYTVTAKHTNDKDAHHLQVQMDVFINHTSAVLWLHVLWYDHFKRNPHYKNRMCAAWSILWWNILYFMFNTLRPRQNGRHFADAILKSILLNENVWIPIEISLKFVPKGPIDNIPALV